MACAIRAAWRAAMPCGIRARNFLTRRYGLGLTPCAHTRRLTRRYACGIRARFFRVITPKTQTFIKN